MHVNAASFSSCTCVYILSIFLTSIICNKFYKVFISAHEWGDSFPPCYSWHLNDDVPVHEIILHNISHDRPCLTINLINKFSVQIDLISLHTNNQYYKSCLEPNTCSFRGLFSVKILVLKGKNAHCCKYTRWGQSWATHQEELPISYVN